MLSVEKIFTAMGFAPVLTVDPQDLTAMKETVDRAVAALERGEHPAIVTRRPCLLIKRDRFQKGMCHVEPDKSMAFHDWAEKKELLPLPSPWRRARRSSTVPSAWAAPSALRSAPSALS